MVLELERAYMSVSERDAAKWGVDKDELFALGRAQLREMFRGSEAHAEVNGVRYRAWVGSYWSASHALTMAEQVGSARLLVAMPNREALFVHQIANPADALVLIKGWEPMLRSRFDSHEGAISPDPYVIRAGSFDRVELHRDGATLRITPPHGFFQQPNPPS